MASSRKVHIVGGGLAGSEAAWQLACAGVPVVLHEMRPVRGTEAHLTDSLAELVCSNSFRSDDAMNNAVGLLHEEMRRAGSLIMRAADRHKLPAGGALAVDRHGFSAAVQETLLAHPLVTLQREEVAGLPPADWESTIIATGPLTSPALAEALATLTGEESLAFFDAIAPIVHHDRIDQSIAWKQSRYDKVGPGGGGADYLNCPLDKEQYDAFVAGLLAGDKTEFKAVGGEHPLLPGLPADRGDRRLRPAKPALRADEAGRPARSAHRQAAVGGRPAAPGQRARDAVEHRGLPDQAQACRAGAAVPHHPRPADRRVRAAGRLHRNTFLNSPRLLDATCA
jgi:methylenetetrahydrofolate--tRNA-(uracil-5-)-methyltransferase